MSGTLQSLSNRERLTPNILHSQPSEGKVAHRFVAEHKWQVSYMGAWSKGHVPVPEAY